MIQFPEWDKQLFITLNDLHASWLDPIMVGFSAHWLWLPLYLTIAFFMIRKKGRIGLLALLFVILTFALTDQLSVHLFKNVFQRLRPCHEADIQAIMHQLEGCGGRYGFISNHAANTFGLAIFTALFFNSKKYGANVIGFSLFVLLFFKRYRFALFASIVVFLLLMRKRWYGIAIFIWAALVSYSRIYVGKHYPLDIICGVAFGTLVGFLVFKLHQFIVPKLKLEKQIHPVTT
ncbi:MAG: phosphatase PAP2 family protein [Prevotellaceae bacterium]|jgi:undecaprenyl-diphosphatase|nr:phosphatase PAP2 family protein [Prevotellaceae bacterium]